MVLFGKRFECYCRSLEPLLCVPLQDDTPVCHDCLVMNGTSKFIINTSIPSRHGCYGVNIWSPAGN